MTAVQPDTVHALADSIFLFGRTLRAALTRSEPDLLPNALAGVLFLLARTGQCRPSVLAAEMHLGQSSLSRHIGELVDRGFIRRDPDPDDKRAHLVTCSPEGLDMLAAIRARRTERLAAQLDDWSEAQVADALDVVARLDAALSPIAAADAATTTDLQRTCS
ncbi:DNA-binding MarR family transcriptional regulator [Rhodococcus sp. SMB37]|uniref:MarR family winged helix-turn-helix transcriptional regulator n=1 Tax=Rhodococcus sp. SMB37 TaxID=2512213 RepID=UPI001044E990|nr:MarR family transcriptional regulator [Rhodococcus sp. SMB37]TCN58144.1 DNA-binding MarR family transcriptional regulator [Rhodococcus sp. SMB37]